MNKEKIILDLMAHENYIPMKKKEIAILLGLNKEEKKELEAVLSNLVQNDKITLTKRGKYMKNDDRNTLMGEYMATGKGYGFVRVDGFKEDLYIPEGLTLNAISGDLVKVTILHSKKDGKTKAKIVRIIERAKDTFVGTFHLSKGFGFVVPDDKTIGSDIFIAGGNINNAKDFQKVVVKIIDFNADVADKKPEGEIIEVIGFMEEKEVPLLCIVRALGIPTDFPSQVISEAVLLRQELGDDRVDFTDLVTVTIDGEDAKDLDDAISIEKRGDHFTLYVHIADVSNYVTEGSELDAEARKRGTSVYLVDTVFPMLPRELSNELCSLNQNEKKAALSVMMDIDFNGKVINYKIVESVVKITERMTYKSVYRIIQGDNEERKKYSHLLDTFDMMKELALILRNGRKKRGSIDFNLKETQVTLDKEGEVANIDFYKTTFANKIIEEFMLITNEVIAEHFYWLGIPFVYRNHDEPDKDKIKQLAHFVKSFGYNIKGKVEDIHPKDIQKLLIDIEGSEEDLLISKVALRSMKQARYETESKGHFGLASNYYCHFTSPIRRYPDLIIHRIIKESITGKLTDSRINHYKGILGSVASLSSKYERRAQVAEREVVKMYMTRYMNERIGEVYRGVITSVTKWGIYVELGNSVEGLVRVSSMDSDYFHYDEYNHSFVGERTKMRYQIGDKVTIKVKSVDLEKRNIDFVLEE